MKVNTTFEASSTSGRIKNGFQASKGSTTSAAELKKDIYKDACKPLSKVTFRMNVNGNY
jgi:hypothetical protein